MAQSSFTLLCIAALLLASSCHAARPNRHLAQAISSANSVAGPGETVNSRSGATSEDGELTVSDVRATGAGPGTTVNCEQQAKSGQVLSEECGGTEETTDCTAAEPKAETKAAASADATAVTKTPAAKNTVAADAKAKVAHVHILRCLQACLAHKLSSMQLYHSSSWPGPWTVDTAAA